MRFHELGKGALKVSEICLGTMTYGHQNTQEDASRQLDLALDRGVNFVDTAEMYPVPSRAETQGSTEAFIGEWIKKTGRRADIVLATKIAGPGRPFDWIRDGKLKIDRKNVQAAVETSLRRLQTDYIDLYQVHWPDRYAPIFGLTAYEVSQERASTPVVEQLQAIAEVIRAGKVRHWGLSNETAWGLTDFVRTARELGLPPPITIQNAYNLINRHYENAVAEAGRFEGVDLIPYSPLAFGHLTGKHLQGRAVSGSRLALFPGFGGRYEKVNVQEAVAAYDELARQHGLTLTQLALAFVRSRWFVKSTIIGATTEQQLVEDLDAFDVELSPELLRGIEQIHARYPSPAA